MSSSRLTHIIITVALLILPFCTKAQNEEPHMSLQDTAHLKANEVLTHADSVTLATDSVMMTKKASYHIWWHRRLCICLELEQSNVSRLLTGLHGYHGQ